MKIDSNEGRTKAETFHSKGRYQIFKNGRWGSWVNVNGGLPEAMEAAQKASDAHLKALRAKK